MSFFSFAQVPITGSNGSPNGAFLTKGVPANDSGYWYKTNFADTFSLNKGVLKGVPGLLVRVGDALYIRNNAATAWVPIGQQRFGYPGEDVTFGVNRLVNGQGLKFTMTNTDSILFRGSSRTDGVALNIDSVINIYRGQGGLYNQGIISVNDGGQLRLHGGASSSGIAFDPNPFDTDAGLAFFSSDVAEEIKLQFVTSSSSSSSLDVGATNIQSYVKNLASGSYLSLQGVNGTRKINLYSDTTQFGGLKIGHNSNTFAIGIDTVTGFIVIDTTIHSGGGGGGTGQFGFITGNVVDQSNLYDSLLGRWSTHGNAGTNPAINFFGTTDNKMIRIKTNSVPSGSITPLNSYVSIDSFPDASVYLGPNAGLADSVADFGGNIGIGAYALWKKAGTGNQSIAIGHMTLSHLTSLGSDVAIGYKAGMDGVSLFRDTYIGIHAGLRSTTAEKNTFIGAMAGELNTTGSFNEFIGQGAGRTCVGCTVNTGVGTNALYGATGSVLSVTITGSSSNWTTATATFSAPVHYGTGFDPTIQATGTAVISGGQIISVTISEPGIGMPVGTTVTFTGDGTSASGTVNIVYGSFNVGLGADVGFFNRAGFYNTYVGYRAGYIAGRYYDSSNAYLGKMATIDATAGVGHINHLTVIGADATGLQSNSIILGRVTAVAQDRVGIGTFAPNNRLQINGRVQGDSGLLMSAATNTGLGGGFGQTFISAPSLNANGYFNLIYGKNNSNGANAAFGIQLENDASHSIIFNIDGSNRTGNGAADGGIIANVGGLGGIKILTTASGSSIKMGFVVGATNRNTFYNDSTIIKGIESNSAIGDYNSVAVYDSLNGRVKYVAKGYFSGGGGTVTSVSGTTNRITSTGGTTPVIDISASYVGQSSITTVGALTSGSLASGFTVVTVPIGGTGLSSTTAYAVITGGTTSTGALQQVSGVGSSGQVLTSNGAAALPSWQTITGTGTVISVATNTGTGLLGGTITTTGTLLIDTTKLTTRLWTYKVVDSLLSLSDTIVVANVGAGIFTGYASGDTIYFKTLLAGSGILIVPQSDSSNLITNTFSVGLSGGQTIYGGNASTEDLTLMSTAAGSKGNIFFGTSTYDEANNRLGIRTTTPDSTVVIVGGLRINNGAAVSGYVWTSTGTDGRGTWAASGSGGVSSITGTANQVIASASTGAITLSTPQNIATTSSPQFLSMGIGTAASSLYSLGVGGNASTTPTLAGFAVGPTVYPAVNANGYMLTTGGTIVEAGSGTHPLLAAANFPAPTVTSGSATVTNTATVYINAAMSATVSGANYALWSDAGLNRFDGNTGFGGIEATEVVDVNGAIKMRGGGNSVTISTVALDFIIAAPGAAATFRLLPFNSDLYFDNTTAGTTHFRSAASTEQLTLNSSGTGFLPNGGLAVGSSSLAASAQLEVISTTKGFLPPRMTTTQMNAVSSPATGLALFNTTAGVYYNYNGSAYTTPGVISGSFSGVGTATTVFTVTFGGTQPNATYKVNVTPTAALSAALFYVTNKTTTTFDVTYLAGLTGTVTFDYALYQ